MRNDSARSGTSRLHWIRAALMLLVIGLVIYYARQRRVDEVPAPPAPAAKNNQPAQNQHVTQADEQIPSEPVITAAKPEEVNSVDGMVIRDLHGEVAFRGTVDLTETLRRIEAGTKLRFPNDGAVFKNRERRLPRQAADYYREWVHPTPGLSGPGPQRIITGEEGEIYYTPDHYRTFRRLDEGPGQASGVSD